MKFASLLLLGTVVSVQANAATGLETAFGLNKATIHRTVYTGQCPGLETSPVEAFFVSDNTPGANGRRVVVRNVTPTMTGGRAPFADREYEDMRSEHTFLDLDTVHRTQTLSVTGGLNDFQFVVLEAGNVLESGTFQLDVQVNETRENRNMQCRWEPECTGGTWGGLPPMCRQVWTCACPL